MADGPLLALLPPFGGPPPRADGRWQPGRDGTDGTLLSLQAARDVRAKEGWPLDSPPQKENEKTM